MILLIFIISFLLVLDLICCPPRFPRQLTDLDLSFFPSICIQYQEFPSKFRIQMHLAKFSFSLQFIKFQISIDNSLNFALFISVLVSRHFDFPLQFCYLFLLLLAWYIFLHSLQCLFQVFSYRKHIVDTPFVFCFWLIYFESFYLLIGEFRSSTFKIIIDIIGLIAITFVIVPIIAFVLLFTFLVFHYFSPVSGLSSASYMIRFHFFPHLTYRLYVFFKK